MNVISFIFRLTMDVIGFILRFFSYIIQHIILAILWVVVVCALAWVVFMAIDLVARTAGP